MKDDQQQVTMIYILPSPSGDGKEDEDGSFVGGGNIKNNASHAINA